MTPTSPEPSLGRRDGAVRRVLFTVLWLNLGVAVAKLVVGWLTGVISMVADGFHSMTDAASNVVGLVGQAVGARPPDREHPYGHRKFETLATLGIGGLLAVTALEVLQSLWNRLQTGAEPQATRLGFGVMLVTMAINLAVTLWEERRGRRLGSDLLLADAAHTRSDVLTSIAVLASLAATRAGYPEIDVVAALLITGFIGRTAFKILRDSGLLLADTAVVPPGRIREIALAVEGVESVHKIRSRGRPQTGHADLHVQVRPELRIDEAHLIGHRVAEALRSGLGFRDVLVHVEPPVGHRTPREETPPAC